MPRRARDLYLHVLMPDEQHSRAAEVERRVAWLRAQLAERGAGGLLLRSRASFAWATLGGLNHVVAGSDAGAVPLLVTADGAWAIAPVIEAARIAAEELSGLPIEVASVEWEDPRAIGAEVARRAGGAVVDEDDLGEALVDRRSQLVPAEHGRMREIASEVVAAIESTLSEIRPSDTEHDVAGRVAGRLLSSGIRAPVLLVAADERIERYRHPIPTSNPVRQRVMIVVVGERWGLHAAATRIADLGPASPELERRASATANVLEAMRAHTQPGATLDAVLDAAKAAYAATGFADEWRLHHQGGTIGYAPRERIAVPGDRTILRPGMAVAWNPSVTGTKLEATMIVTDGEPDELAR
ncbi:MAG: M24 family metallopeptidase [Candidatus Limnocylindria bacterium]